MNNTQSNPFNRLQRSPQGQQGARRDNRSMNQQLNGASLISDRPNVPRPNLERQAESYQIWGDNVDNDSFVTLLKILRSDTEGIKLQQTILRSRPPTVQYLKVALGKFCKGVESNKQYEDKYRQKSHLGLTMEELGFKKGAVMQQSQDLDILWMHLIEVSAIELSTNKLATYRALRRCAQQQGIYKKLYQAQIGGQILKPKTGLINSYFKTGSKNVDEEHHDFEQLLTIISEYYFQQFNSLVNCLTQIFDEDRKYEGFKNLFEPNTNYSMLKILWNAYCKLSQEVLTPDRSGRITKRYEKYSNLGKQFAEKIMKLLMSIIKLFYLYLTKFTSDEKPAIIHGDENFGINFMKRLDTDIILVEKIDICKGINTDSFSRYIVELFLLLFPFQQLRNQTSESKSKQIQRAVRELKSQSLQLVKLLYSQSSNRSADPAKIIKQFQDVAKGCQWNAFNSSWRRWLGIFLMKFRQHLVGNKNAKQLTKRIISLCKNVIANYFQQFWSEDSDFCLKQIKYFLKEAVQTEYESTTINQVSILPIFTKLLGKVTKKYSQQVIELLSSKIVGDIFDSVIQTLQLDKNNKQYQKYERIIYISQDERQDKEPILQQQIKFICRLVELSVDNLKFFEKSLSSNNQQSDENEDITDVILINNLLQFFYNIPPDTISGLKCLRYLMNAINSLFICEQTRNLVCIALSVLDSGKLNHIKALRSIVSCCYDYDKKSEKGRQTQKLRKAISFHLNCVVKVSDSLQQYFPTTTQREASHSYRKLHEYIDKNDFKLANQLITAIKQECSFGFRSVQWFYEFVKLLESSQLTSIDFDTIRLLLLKMRIKNDELREYANMSAIVDILNHGKLEEIIIATLTPILKREKTKNLRQKYILGLANKEFQGFINQSVNQQHFKEAKYSNKSYRLFKEKFIQHKQKYEFYCRLSGCLSMIETMLKLTLEGDFPLLKKMKSYNFIFQSLFSDQPYMYDVKFTYSYQKSREQRNGLAALLGNEWVEKQISSSVNLMHCISSFWDFQERLGIDDTEHLSSSLNLFGHFSLDIQLKDYNFRIVKLAQENILTDINRKSESIGISTVSKILQYIILLGYGKTLYFSILSRNYPLNRGLMANTNLTMLEQFMDGMAHSAIRRNSTLRERQYVIELLSVFIRQKHFGEYIKSNIYLFKDALSRGRQFANIQKSTRLITQLLHFLNMLLSLDTSPSNIKFVKSCLSDPVQFGMKLVSHCQNRIRLLSDIQQNAKNSKYGTFSWVLNIRQAALCKLSLLLYLGLSSYLISNEHQSLSLSLSSLILKNSAIFLKSCEISFSQMSSKALQKLVLKESLKIPSFTTTINSTYFIVNDFFLDAILLNSPFSFIDSYIEQPWQVLQNSLPKQGKQLVLTTYRYNAINAFHYTNEALIQFYYLLVNSLFKRGQTGLFFVCQPEKKIDKKLPLAVLFKKYKAKNELSSRMLVGQSESFSNICFRISRDIQREIWQQCNSSTRMPRDIGLSTIGVIIDALEGKIEEESHHLSQCRRIVDKFITYLTIVDNRFHFSVLINTIHSLQKISQKIFHLALPKKQNPRPHIKSYLQRLNLCLKSIQANISFDSLNKLSEEHLIVLILECLHLFESEIENIQCLEKYGHHALDYLESEDRLPLFQKLKLIVKSFLPLLSSPNFSASSSITILVLQILSKAFILDHFSKKSQFLGIIKPIGQELFTKLEKLSSKITNQDDIIIIYMLKFIMEISIFTEQQQNRQIMKLLKVGFDKIAQKIEKITEIKTLTQIVKNTYILGAFSAVSFQQNWKNQEYQNILDKVFIIIQGRPIQFLCEKIIPESEIQLQLSKKNLIQIRRGKNTSTLSIFSLYNQFNMYHLVNNYLLFQSFAIKYSLSLHEFCNSTFNRGLLEDLSLDRLRQSLISVIEFMNKFASICFNSQIEQFMKINAFACVDFQFIRQMNLLSLCFENYKNKSDFYSSIFDTLTLLHEAIILLCQTWEKYDWKSINTNWRPNRKELILQFQKLITIYKGFFKDYKEANYEKLLSTIGEYLRNDLQSFNV